MKFLIGAALALLLTTPVFAGEFTPGRPGNTDSAIAVDPGRWQIETEIVSFADGDGADTLSIAETAFRYGLAPGWDIEAIVAPYTRVDAGGGDIDGFGDVTFRVRRTLQGLDGEGPSLGIIAYLTLPTAEDGLGADDVEGGVEAAGDFALADRWSLAWTIGAGAQSNGDDYDALVFGGAGIGYELTERWGLYGEAFLEHADSETSAVFQTGATYLLTEETQLDLGFEFGLDDDSDDARIFIGWAHRL